MNTLEIKDLSRSYPGFTLDRLNLTLPAGCILGLIGENGAGKSTTIKLILDMIHRDSGSITILGRDNLEAGSLLKEDIGVVLDDPGIPYQFNTAQVGKVMAGIFRNWSQETYERLLQQLRIPQGKPFKEFSRGNKMKLGIAVAMSHGARLLILDEATSGLDPVVRDEVLELFIEFTRDEDHAILISSHIVSDLEKLCDYIAFLHKGKLMLFEEKDVLLSTYGVLHCSAQQLAELDPRAIVGKKVGSYGAQALVRRDRLPAGMSASPISIEELFVYMVREGTV